jgi:SAM-dependent methyltransferase
VKLKTVNIKRLREYYKHPSISFFRAIELQTLNQLCSDMQFDNNSLDVGCGDGYIAKELYDLGFKYGIDNGEANDVQLGIESGFYEKVFLGSAEKLPLENQSLGFIFSNCVLEHIPPIESVISEVGRCLKPGGIFLFTVPSNKFGDNLYVATILKKLRLDFMARRYIKFRNRMLNHFNCNSQNEWARRLEKNNMKIEYSTHYMSREALNLWDKVAILLYVGKLFGFDLSNLLSRKYIDRMDMLIIKAQNEFPSSDGACLAIMARKL